MTSILCIVPPFDYGGLKSIASKSPPLGMAIIAAYLEQFDYRVKILDAYVQALTLEYIREEIQKTKPEIIFIGSSTATFPKAIQILEGAKEINPNIITVFGGIHVTNSPTSSLKHKCVDYLVLGEGELTAKELVDYISGKSNLKKNEIQGIAYLEEGELHINEKRPLIKDLDTLPMPAYHLLPMDMYKSYGWYDVGRKFSTMITSRGCPSKCSFCISSKNFNHMWRARSAPKVFEEMKLLYEKYKIRHIYLEDDEFCVNHKRVIELSKMIKDSGMDLIWECLTRVNHVDDELLKSMAEGKCKSILYGAELGYEDGFKKINKTITLDMIKKAVKLTQKYKILAKVTFMMGFPWESKTEIKKTINFAKSLNADVTFFSMLSPYPGSYIYDEMVSEGLISEPENWEGYLIHGSTKKSSEPIIRTRYLTAKELAYWNGRAYLELYTQPKYILKKIKSLTNVHELKRSIGAGKDLLGLSIKRILKSN